MENRLFRDDLAFAISEREGPPQGHGPDHDKAAKDRVSMNDLHQLPRRIVVDQPIDSCPEEETMMLIAVPRTMASATKTRHVRTNRQSGTGRGCRCTPREGFALLMAAP